MSFEVLTTDRITELKVTQSEMKKFHVTGYVLTNEEGHKRIIDLGAVRHLHREEAWELMHGPKRNDDSEIVHGAKITPVDPHFQD